MPVLPEKFTPAPTTDGSRSDSGTAASPPDTACPSYWQVLADETRAAQAAHGHIPVLLQEVLAAMDPRDGALYVDGTFGAGGYTRALLAAADCRVIGLDRDPLAEAAATRLQQEAGERLRFLSGCFGDMADVLKAAGIDQVNGIVLDIGVSSMQLDDAARGFSFREDGPLDMRMAQHGQSAADLVNTASEAELADILFHYGEERAARKIARRLVAARTEAPITTTRQLRDIVHSVLPMHGGHKTDTATRSFQALRIAVNDELGELARALDAALGLLVPGGRLVVVTFHSLEDALVKRFLRKHSAPPPAPSRHAPAASTNAAFTPLLDVVTPKPVTASAAEVAANPRARSARLRAATRSAAPATGGT